MGVGGLDAVFVGLAVFCLAFRFALPPGISGGTCLSGGQGGHTGNTYQNFAA